MGFFFGCFALFHLFVIWLTEIHLNLQKKKKRMTEPGLLWTREWLRAELAIDASDLGHRVTPGAKFRGRQKRLQEKDPGVSLVVQCLGLGALTAVELVQSMVGDLRSHQIPRAMPPDKKRHLDAHDHSVKAHWSCLTLMWIHFSQVGRLLFLLEINSVFLVAQW